MPKQEFIFINKNSRSQHLTRADGSERSLVFSHVRQSILIRKRRPAETVFAVSGVLHVEDTANRSKKTHRPEPTQQHLYPMTVFEKVLEKRGIQPNYSTRRVMPSIERTLPLFNVKDPQIHPYIDVLLTFYGSPLEPRMFPMESMSGDLVRCSLSLASQHPTVLYALLCNTAGAMCAFSYSQEHYRHSEYFRYRAVRALRDQLEVVRHGDEQACLPSTAYAVALLLFIEGNLEAVEAHLIGLERLITLAGGIIVMPTQIMMTVLECSFLCCAMIRRQPIIQAVIPSRYHLQAATLEYEYRHLTSTNTTASRFSTEAIASLLGVALLNAIHEKRKCLLLRELYSSQHRQVSRDDAEHLRLLEAKADHNLLDLQPEHTHDNDTSYIVRDGLRYLLFAFCQPVVHIAPSVSAFNRSVIQTCLAMIESIEASTARTDCADLYLWILVLAAHISQEGDNWSIFVERMAGLVEELELVSVCQVEQILLGFFWFPQYFRKTLEAAWADCTPLFSHNFRQKVAVEAALSSLVAGQTPTGGKE